MVIIAPIFLLLLINLWLFMPFFGLGLFGDDWLAIFRYSYYLEEPKHLGIYSTEYFNYFKYFLNAYGPQDMLMAFLYKNFGSGSNIYFILSYILRVGAALSIYLPAFYLTKNKWAALFAIVFFLFSSIGLEASNWVFNMPSYLLIILFNFFVYFYLRYHGEIKIKHLIFTYFFFTLSFISTPIRAHGLIPFIIFIEIFWLISQKNWKSLKLSLIRISGFLFIFLLIFFLGFKETLSGNFFNAIPAGLNSSFSFFSQNRFDFLFYPIVTLGSMLIPYSFAPNIGELTSFSQYLFKIFVPIFSIYIIVAIILTHCISNLNHRFLPIVALTGVFWAILVPVIYRFNLPTFSNSTYVSLLLIGGYILIIVISLFAYLKSNTFIKNGLLITLSWAIISYIYAWWQSLASVYLTTHRYLIISSVGISLLLANIIGLGKNTKSVIVLLVLGSIFVIIHTFSTRSFLNEQYQTHNRAVVEKIWSAMPHIPEVGKSEEPLIFYFEGDGTNGSIIGDSITFGFPPHMALLYGISEENKMPIPMSDFKQLQSTVLDGKSLVAHGRVAKPLPVERIYAFHLKGTDNLINITDEVRKKLIQIVE